MKSILFLTYASASLVAANNHLLPRAIGDKCQAPQGKGICQKTSNCNGISYPDGYCPSDPTDIQCCLNIGCDAPHADNLCRHVGQGCSGGAFVSNLCPGDSSIRCCVGSSKRVEAPATPSCADPQPNTCTIYPNCLKEKLKCGAKGYPSATA